MMGGFSALDAIADAAPSIGAAAVAVGSPLVLTFVGRFAAPIGHPIHKHMPAIAGILGAGFTFATYKSYSAALASLLTGLGIWGVERLTDFQAFKLLPKAAV